MIMTPTTSTTMTPLTIMMMMMAKTLATSIKLAVNRGAAPHEWSQNWSHLLATAANHSRISTSKALQSLPWAQGVAGLTAVASARASSNPRKGALTVTPQAVPWSVPPKIRELEATLRLAGFVRQASKGSHRKWFHPSGRFVIVSGSAGDDAKKYQEQQVAEAILAVAKRAPPE